MKSLGLLATLSLATLSLAVWAGGPNCLSSAAGDAASCPQGAVAASGATCPLSTAAACAAPANVQISAKVTDLDAAETLPGGAVPEPRMTITAKVGSSAPASGAACSASDGCSN